MRGLPLVLTLALVLVAAPLAFPTSTAQVTGSIAGTVCAAPVGYSYPYPYYEKDAGECYNDRLPGATVTATLDTVTVVTRSATTAEDGTFTIDNLPAGTYTLTIARDGFEGFEQAVEVDGAERVAATLQGVEVTVPGHVESDDGDAIADAFVEFCCPMEEGRRAVQTDAAGDFEATVVAGFYSINVQAPGHQSFSEYRLVDGEALEFALVPVPPPDAVLRGVVQDQDGNPVEDARVSAYSYGNCCYAYPEGDGVATSPAYYGGENFTFTDAQGRYTLGVYAGEGSLSVQKEGYAGQTVYFTIAAGDEQTRDFEVLKYPEKTAHIVGQVTDADGNGLPFVSISIRLPQYGIWECSIEEANAGGESKQASFAEPGYPAYYDPGCAITVDEDGRFEGDVTPGYAILQVYQDHWRTCDTSTDADGSSTTDCGPEYFSYTQTTVLAADGTTQLDIRLRERPAPDAVVSGYLVDAETNEAILTGSISFSNQETYGWGSAQVDEDGSYKLRLRHGYHSVYVWAEGYLPWEGVLDVEAGDTAFDVQMTRGNESWGGGCCYHYGGRGMDYAVAEDAAAPSSTHAAGGGAPAGAPEPAGLADGDDQGEAAEGAQYEDLGGGLGPYDPEAREKVLDDQEHEEAGKGSPGPGFALLALGLLAGVAMLRRRK